MSDTKEKIAEAIAAVSFLEKLGLEERVEALNEIRAELHKRSPFKGEPVDFIRWVPNERVYSNDYNPNKVAPPEMDLLRTSIMADGYTQPIVTNLEDDRCVVIDGFHRNRVGRECEDVLQRVKGYLPVVQIRESQAGVENRMASTIRHNRARGKHQVNAMSDIVIELKRRNWTNEKIAKNLGMDEDEILRLCQITGLTEVFSDQEFSRAWDLEGEITDQDFEELTDDVEQYSEEEKARRVVNTSDENRTFHTWDKWECYKAGFYNTTPPKGMGKEQCREAYRDFLGDLDRFQVGLKGVTDEWQNSCEHYLTNVAMNRIAWLGQAAMCYATGIPAEFRGGFSLLSDEQQSAANELALKYLNIWLERNGLDAVTMDEAQPSRQSDIY
jgi:ParB-like chromosome segregation protein Spo0J